MKLLTIVILSLASISSFAEIGPNCKNLALKLSELTTPKVRIGPFAAGSTENETPSYLIKAMEINPSICDHLERVNEFVTNSKVRELAE